MTVADLEAYGLARMSEEAIGRFLDAQSTGVLGLPDDGAPYVVPMSYAYDGGDSLYFTYLQGESSRKTTLTDAADAASFLVFSVETMFNWRSVALEGALAEVPQRRWDDLEDVLASAWRPELFRTGGGATVAIYRFDITDRSGVEHTDLAPGFQE